MAARKTYDNIRVDNADGITTVTLNRPDKRNAMSPALDAEMLDCILNLEGDPQRNQPRCAADMERASG